MSYVVGSAIVLMLICAGVADYRSATKREWGENE